MKLGLVMEGGGMSGVFTAGVLDVLMRNGIVPDCSVGVSAGAIFGINVKSGQIGRVIRFNKRYCRDPRYVSIWSFLFTGDIFGANFCYNKLTYKLDPFDYNSFEKHPMEFYAVCTDMETGKAVYHKCDRGTPDDDMMWIRASASMPLVSRPVRINGGLYLDGGIADSIPLSFIESLGYTRNIVILTKPQEFRMVPKSYIKLAKKRYANHPAFVEAVCTRHIRYNETIDYIAERENQGDAVVIRPSHATDAKVVEKKPKNLQLTYDDGVRQAENKMQDIIKLCMK